MRQHGLHTRPRGRGLPKDAGERAEVIGGCQGSPPILRLYPPWKKRDLAPPLSHFRLLGLYVLLLNVRD
jgi:hypothetical protein